MRIVLTDDQAAEISFKLSEYRDWAQTRSDMSFREEHADELNTPDSDDWERSDDDAAESYSAVAALLAKIIGEQGTPNAETEEQQLARLQTADETAEEEYRRRMQDWELRDHVGTLTRRGDDDLRYGGGHDHQRECDECGYFRGAHATECSQSRSSRLKPAIESDIKIAAVAVTSQYQSGTAAWRFNGLGLWDFGSAAMELMPIGKPVRVTIEVVDE
jgi:hypothetical protein